MPVESAAAPLTGAALTGGSATAAPTRVAQPAVVDFLAGRVRDLHRPRPIDRSGSWPADGRLRWALRLLLSLPFLAAAILGRAFQADVPNAQLIERASRIAWDRADPSWVGHLYPPITTVVGALVPGGTAGLAVLGALGAGILLHAVIESMRRRGFARSTVVVFAVALAANPLYAFAATESLPVFVGVGCFGLGFADLVRFTIDRDTQSGFRAGILLMLAALSDPSGVVYVTVGAIAAPLLSIGRTRNGRWYANTLVVLFPTLSAFGTVMLLDQLFSGHAFGIVRALVHIDPARLTIFSTLVTTPIGWLWLATMAGVWAIALVSGRPEAVPLTLLLFAAVIGGYLLGLIPETAGGTVYLMMLLAAIGLVPPAARGRLALGVNLLALLELGVAWSTAFTRPIVLEWIQALVAAVQR